MLIPFLFDLTNTKVNGLIWGSESGDATAEDNPYAPASYPKTAVILEAWTVMSSADNGEVQIGTYDLSTDTFTANEDILATKVSAGGITHIPCDGIRLVLSDTVVPAVKLTGSATSINISGDVSLHVPGLTGAETLAILVAANSGTADGSPINLEQGGGVDTLQEETALNSTTDPATLLIEA